MAARWGIDLGGTKIEGVVLDESGAARARLRVPTEAAGGYGHILEQIALLFRLLETEVGPPSDVIGIGTPGTEDPDSGLLRNSNTVCLNGQPLSRDLSLLLGRDVRLANDANCFALAEATIGAARGCGVVFGVILGTGVGGGVVVDGRVLSGLHGIAGEWGHNELELNGAQCYCGKRGCVETVLSGPALERFYTGLSGTTRTLEEIATLDEPHARATIDRLCEGFGKAMSVVINILDPDGVVIGGGVGNVDALYAQGREELAKWVFNSEVRTQLLRPQLGDSAGVFGAALLA